MEKDMGLEKLNDEPAESGVRLSNDEIVEKVWKEVWEDAWEQKNLDKSLNDIAMHKAITLARQSERAKMKEKIDETLRCIAIVFLWCGLC